MDGHEIKLPKFKLSSNLLKLHFTYESLKKAMVGELQKIPNLTDLRMSPEITKLVCAVIEEVCYKSKKNKKGGKMNKKTLVIDILNELFELTEEEQKLVDKDIEFICDNNLIHRTTLCEKFFRFFF